MRAVFDTNILIDYLLGNKAAAKEIARYSSAAISIVTFMEVLVGCKSAEEQRKVKSFLSRFELIQLDLEIAELAVNLRKTRNIKLPDAVIWASAKKHEALLITRNSKDFSKEEPDIRLPYRV